MYRPFPPSSSLILSVLTYMELASLVENILCLLEEAVPWDGMNSYLLNKRLVNFFCEGSDKMLGFAGQEGKSRILCAKYII